MANPASDVLRWKRVEVDATRLALSGIALALPVAVGAAAGHTGISAREYRRVPSGWKRLFKLQLPGGWPS